MFKGEVNPVEPIIFVDGGSKNYKDIGFIVGDSSIIDMHEKLSTEKNTSDLAYVLSFIPKNIKVVNALGFLGGRPDHELINYGEFFNFLNRNKSRIILSELLTLYSAQAIELNFKGTFSVINSLPGKIKISGNCDYIFDDLAHRAYSSHFLSNIAHGEFKIASEVPFGVYQLAE